MRKTKILLLSSAKQEKFYTLLTEIFAAEEGKEALEKEFLPIQNTKPLILIAEDDQVNRLVVKKQVESLGFQAEVAEDGEQALKALKQREHALILMDCEMPVLNGIQTAQMIREMDDEYYRQLPIIAFTAHTSAEKIEEFSAVGINDHLIKPVKKADLKQKITFWLKEVYKDRYVNLAGSDKNLEQNNELESIDVRLGELAGSCGDALVFECIELFLDETPKSLDKISEFVLGSDYESIRKEAHKLKGSAASMGSVSLPDLCQELMASAEAKDEKKINAITKEIKQKYADLKPVYNSQSGKYKPMLDKLQPIS